MITKINVDYKTKNEVSSIIHNHREATHFGLQKGIPIHNQYNTKGFHLCRKSFHQLKKLLL